MMKMYWEYLKYVMVHKKNVFIECMKLGLYIHAFTHDISKLFPSEFIPYAQYFYGNSKDEATRIILKNAFDRAWLIHQNRNNHHWDHWVNAQGTSFEMSNKAVLCMVADWKAMSRKFGDTAWDFYSNNKEKMILHPKTVDKIERHLKP